MSSSFTNDEANKEASQRELAVEFDVHFATISLIYNKITWAHIEPSLKDINHA